MKVRIRPVAINFSRVADALFEKIQGQVQFAFLFVRDRADIPVTTATLFSCERNKVPRLAGKRDTPVPVGGNILNELEGIRSSLVIFGQVGGHLYGAVDHDIERQLACQRALDLLHTLLASELQFEYSGREIHGPGE
jgi:hypothetical protein